MAIVVPLIRSLFGLLAKGTVSARTVLTAAKSSTTLMRAFRGYVAYSTVKKMLDPSLGPEDLLAEIDGISGRSSDAVFYRDAIKAVLQNHEQHATPAQLMMHDSNPLIPFSNMSDVVSVLEGAWTHIKLKYPEEDIANLTPPHFNELLEIEKQMQLSGIPMTDVIKSALMLDTSKRFIDKSLPAYKKSNNRLSMIPPIIAPIGVERKSVSLDAFPKPITHKPTRI